MLKVSIVSGVYNREKYLDKLINSFVAQTYKNIEIILFNNASKDNSQSIIDKYVAIYPALIKSYQTDINLGAGGGRNKGMEYATGDYICFVDSDDYIGKEYVEELVATAENKHLPDMVISGFTKVDMDAQVLYKRDYKNESEALYQSIAPWGKMYLKSYLEKNQLKLRNLPFAEDVLFTIELIMTKPSIALASTNEYFWVNNVTSTSNVEFRGFPPNALKCAFEYLDYIKCNYTDDLPILDYFATKYFIWYLLHSGRNMGSKRMIDQYRSSFEYLDRQFPGYNKCKYISPFYPKSERKIVRIVVWAVISMKKVGFAQIFFSIYSKAKVDKFWPKL